MHNGYRGGPPCIHLKSTHISVYPLQNAKDKNQHPYQQASVKESSHYIAYFHSVVNTEYVLAIFLLKKNIKKMLTTTLSLTLTF